MKLYLKLEDRKGIIEHAKEYKYLIVSVKIRVTRELDKLKNF